MISMEKIMANSRHQQRDHPGVMLVDSELIKQAVYDSSSFTTLYRKYVTKVYRYIFSRVHNQAEAEDLTSQVFMTVLQKLKYFGGKENFNAWLFTIARNKVIDNYRRQPKWVPLDEALVVQGQDGDPLNRLTQNELYNQLAMVLKDLKPDQQEMLQLRFSAELSYAEIGKVIGKREAAVKMSIHRLLQKLQNEMERSHE